MYDDFVKFSTFQLMQKGYITNLNPFIPGVSSLLYATSSQITSVGPVKFFNHFLFVDWENDQFGQLQQLLETRKKFSTFVNQTYKVPHAWRMKLPNLGLITLSQHGFSAEAITCAQNTYFIPWQGGETGQLILLDLQKPDLTCHYPRTYKQTGSIPLGYAVEEIRTIFNHFTSAG